MKSIDPNLSVHLKQTVTTLATIWRITREDSVQFFFTDHDQDLVFENNTYKASTGYNRSALATNSQLSVDNLDVEGIYAETGIDEEELRNGLFDYADVEISMVNWMDLSQGELKLKKGRLGEAQISTQGFYTAEVRGLTQQLSQTLLQIYQPECRVDLGSPQCGVPILPNILNREQVVDIGPTFASGQEVGVGSIAGAGEYYRVPTGNGTAPVFSILTNGNFETDGVGIFASANPPTGWEVLGSNAFEVVTDDAGLTPDSGNYFLTAALFDLDSEIRQDVSPIFGTVTATNIDAGNVSITFTSRRANSDIRDTGRVRLEFLDIDKTLISTALDTGDEVITPLDTWVDRNLASTVLPTGTRHIRLRLSYISNRGARANIGFDNLTLLLADTTTVGTILEPLGNPSFETDAAGTYNTTTQMTDWTVISGSWDLVTTINGLNPNNGTKFLVGTDTFSTGELQQDVLLTPGFSTDRIDKSGLKAWFSIQRADAHNQFDSGRVRVEFLDANNKLRGIGLNTELEFVRPQDTWESRVMPVTTLPRLTRKIRVRLDYNRVGDTQSFFAFDDVQLVVFDDEYSLYENIMYEVTTAGTTATKQPTYNATVGATTTDGTAVLTARNAWMRSAVITSVTNRRQFTVSVDEPRAVDGWFKNGALFIFDGDNTGRSAEIKEWTQSTSEIQLYLPLPFDITPGTRIRLYRGCQKRLGEDCVDIFNNAVNFRGEPFIPGSDSIVSYPDAR